MRVIAGKCRGQELNSLPGADTRPTLNRVKEGMFSAVQAAIPGASVLDLYAGSGQLGFEALSRGAALCHFVDSAPKAVQVLHDNAKILRVEPSCHIHCIPAEKFLKETSQLFDLIMLDPPFVFTQWDELLQALLPVCQPEAQVLCETHRDTSMPQAVGAFCLKKQYRYGTVQVWRYGKQK